MNFITRFLVVVIWLMGISASVFAVTKKCAKSERSILRFSNHTAQKNPQPENSSTGSERATNCSGSIQLFIARYLDFGLQPGAKQLVTYSILSVPHLTSGFSDLLYAPPRQFLFI